MSVLRKFLTINLCGIILCSGVLHAASLSSEAVSNNKSFVTLGFLDIKPTADNLKYATFVSGTQPYYQSWHYQAINPDYHPTFELGFNYAFPCTTYSASIFWTHLNSNDSDSKQASTNIDTSTIDQP